MPLTFKTILRTTPANRFNSANHVKISKIKVSRKGGVAVKAVARSFTPGSSSSYDSEIQFLPGNSVKLSCSCDDFLFRFEYALFRRGAADIRHSNGEPPEIRNPAFTPGCCKHLIALREVLVDKGIMTG
jgi:hypothetical protein